MTHLKNVLSWKCRSVLGIRRTKLLSVLFGCSRVIYEGDYLQGRTIHKGGLSTREDYLQVGLSKRGLYTGSYAEGGGEL